MNAKAQCEAAKKIEAAGFRTWEGSHSYKYKRWSNLVGAELDEVGNNVSVRVYSDSGYAIVTKEGFLRKETMNAEDFALLLEKSGVAKEKKMSKAQRVKLWNKMYNQHPAMQELREMAAKLGLTEEQNAKIGWEDSFMFAYSKICHFGNVKWDAKTAQRFQAVDIELLTQWRAAIAP
jgi:hypothetical protein